MPESGSDDEDTNIERWKAMTHYIITDWMKLRIVSQQDDA